MSNGKAGIIDQLLELNRRRRPAIAELQISVRQVELLQQRGISRVVVQIRQEGLHFCAHHTGITLSISSVQPLVTAGCKLLHM